MDRGATTVNELEHERGVVAPCAAVVGTKQRGEAEEPVDFGLATPLKDDAAGGSAGGCSEPLSPTGSLLYMPPELLRDKVTYICTFSPLLSFSLSVACCLAIRTRLRSSHFLSPVPTVSLSQRLPLFLSPHSTRRACLA